MKIPRIKTRILIKRDTTENWNKALDFIPLLGEFIVYTDYRQRVNENGELVNIPGIKIGDGLAYCVDLPFVTDAADISEVESILNSHIDNTDIHVSNFDRENWDSKITCCLNGEMLRFN